MCKDNGIIPEDNSDIVCPFCGETDFDKSGLKSHLLEATLFGGVPRCQIFEDTEI